MSRWPRPVAVPDTGSRSSGTHVAYVRIPFHTCLIDILLHIALNAAPSLQRAGALRRPQGICHERLHAYDRGSELGQGAVLRAPSSGHRGFKRILIACTGRPLPTVFDPMRNYPAPKRLACLH
jgi:hypothetical protein